MAVARDEPFVSRGRRAAYWLLILAGLAAAYSVLLIMSGGFDGVWFGIRLRSRGWERPAVISIALALAAVTLAARSSRDRGVSAWAAVDSIRGGRFLTIAAIVWTLVAGVRFSTYAAGGSDSFGYVSQARLFTAGTLTDVLPMRPEFSWRDATESLIPLGYRPAAEPGRMAPVYPPGLPLLMASVSPLGERAAYAIVPVLGACVILCTAMWGTRLGDALAGGVAAAWLSLSATFLLMQFSPMSDVPVTAFWLGALLAAGSRWSAAPVVAGILVGLAVLTRPNLAPLALVVGTLLASQRRRPRDVAAFALPVAGAVAVLLWIQWQRYGHPFASGYGVAGDMFAVAHVRPNAHSYAARVTGIYTPLIWLWVVSPFALRGVASTMRLALLTFIVGVWLAYLAYTPFEPWFFTRFLLPAIPLMLLLASMVALAAIRRLPLWTRSAAAITVLLLTAVTAVEESKRRGVFDSVRTEQKYPLAGHYVRDHLAPSSYVLAAQHSGSVRLYSGRPTIRWDIVGGDQLDVVVRDVRASGGDVYVVVDDEELPRFATHFDGQAAVKRLRPLAQFGQARVFAIE